MVRGYFPSRIDRPDAAFRDAWRRLADRPCPRARSLRESPDVDWAARWIEAARPVRASPGLWIAPPGVEVPAGEDAIVVRIVPGTGFGTGSHPTTRALLRWLAADPGFDTVLDVGTGSGVLAIAAARLGARFSVGLDLDPDAIANAAENRAADPRGSRLALILGGLDAVASEARFDRVLANIDASTLRTAMEGLALRCAPAGRIGVAGALASERDAVLARAGASRLRLVDERLDSDPAMDDTWWSGWLAPVEATAR